MPSTYISVIQSVGSEPIQIPLDPDDTLLIPKLMALISPDVVNLKYRVVWDPFRFNYWDGGNFSEQTKWKTLRILNNRLQPPVDGWDSQSFYYCVMKSANTTESSSDFAFEELSTQELCADYQKDGFCEKQFDNLCKLIHGDYCDICQRFSLHPFNEDQRENHLRKCIEKQEFLNEIQFQVCAICLEIIGQSHQEEDKKSLTDLDRCQNNIKNDTNNNGLYAGSDSKRFGFMENCSHVYCLQCIEKWRRGSNHSDFGRAIDHNERKRCPQCRIISNTVISSDQLIDQDEKHKILAKTHQENVYRLF